MTGLSLTDTLKVQQRRAIVWWVVVGLAVVTIAAVHAQREAAQREGEPVAFESFDAGVPDGWELTENARLARSERGQALVFRGPGHALWHAPFEGEPRLRLRYRHGEGIGEVVLCSSAGPAGIREYQVRFEGEMISVIRNVDERPRVLGGAEAPLRPGAWHDVSIRCAGATIEVSLGDQPVLSVVDREPVVGPGLAFGCIDGEGFAFDDIAVFAAGAVEQPLETVEQPRETVEQPRETVEQPLEVVEGPLVATTTSQELVAAMLDTFIPSKPADPPAMAPLKFVATVLGQPSWTRTGGPPGGLGYDIRMRPGNPGTMYVTDAWAGVFKSVDGGNTWSPSNGTGRSRISIRRGTTGEAIPVFCLTIDPHNPDIIWAGTQSFRGIFRSADGGQTWAKMDNGVKWTTGITFRGFTVDPRGSNIVYAAAELESWAWAKKPPQRGKTFDMTQGVVFKTTDGGRNWKQVWRGQSLARYIWIAPNAPNVVYVSTGIFDREAANCNYKAGKPGGEGVIKSEDGGKTWVHVNKGLGNLYVGSLFMHPRDPNVLLAGVGNNSYRQGGGVYLTTNGGQFWEHTLTNETITSVELSTSDPRIAYAGSEHAVYRSVDGGREWARISGPKNGWGSPGFRAGFPIDFQVQPRNPNVLLANNYGGGNFRSNDGGKTWMDASTGYTGAQIRGLAVDPAHPNRVFASARSGAFVTPDAGRHWQGLSHPLALVHDGDGIAVDPTNPGHLLASSSALGILYRSLDGGMNWSVVAKLPATKLSWRTVAFAPSKPSTIYAGSAGYTFVGTFDDKVAGKGIWVSQDGGAHWKPANNALSQDAHVATLAVHPKYPAIVWAATTNRGLLRTTDGGVSWKAVNIPSPRKLNALSVAISPTAPYRIYAGLARGGVFRGDAGGVNFKPLPSGLSPEASITEVAIDPTNASNVYVADLLSGVYRWDAKTAGWEPINNGLQVREVNALAIAANGKALYAGTEGAGVFRLDAPSP